MGIEKKEITDMYNLELFEELGALLRMESRYCSDDGVLLKNAIVEDALQLKPELIRLLLTNERLKNNFFKDIDGITIFDKVRFQKFVMNKRFLPDSYTSFKNKIGLIGDNEDFLSESREVVLSWPYKDCVLEGGQTKEDAKRNEIFWNEILAPDQITRLTEPKVLSNFKKYSIEGEETISEITKEDNLIIKGNNLLALHSLAKTYKGKVKLIYIDPPYNTGSDSFQYNDNFNHSSWLTFMKNRLEVAKELLSDDGIIFVQCDDNEQAYLKVIMDEVFKINNFINTLVVRSSTPSGTKTAHKEKTIIKQKDYIHIYKNEGTIKLNPQYIKKDKWDTHYSLILEKKDNKYILLNLIDALIKENILKEGDSLKDININDDRFKKYYLANKNKICRLQSHKNTKAEAESRKLSNVVYEHFDENSESKGLFYNGQVITQLSQSINKVYDNQNFTNDLSMLLCDLWNDIDFQNTQNEGGVSFPTAKKPEILLYRIIDLATQKNDIVLDYHLGSGTTAAVAHKMGRRFIGIEQMDYGENDSVVRLRKVIGGKIKDGMFEKNIWDKSGISKAVDWKGGGSFVYCELAKANQNFVDEIDNAETKEQLNIIWENIQINGFLSWKVNPKTINEEINDFSELSIEDSKRFLIEVLDKNLLYIPLSEIDNQEFNVSVEDKLLTNKFYGR